MRVVNAHKDEFMHEENQEKRRALFAMGKRMFRILGPWEQTEKCPPVWGRRDIRGKVKVKLWQDGERFRFTTKESWSVFQGPLESAQAETDKALVADGWELVD